MEFIRNNMAQVIFLLAVPASLGFVLYYAAAVALRVFGFEDDAKQCDPVMRLCKRLHHEYRNHKNKCGTGDGGGKYCKRIDDFH